MQHFEPQSALEAAAARLVQSLGGRWRRGGAMCRCPAHDDRSPSLSVRIGTSSLLFKCFAGCDTVDVIRAVRRRRFAVPARQSVTLADVRNREWGFAAQAHRIWTEAQPIPGTRGERYLAGRGILALPGALRYHPAAPIGRGGLVRFRPALIAAVCQGNQLISIQRSFLDPIDDVLARDLEKPKLTLGRPLGGAVRLAAVEDQLGLAEGIESALSATSLLGIPAWATLGGERLPHIRIPPGVRRLFLLPDNDRSGRLAERKARFVYSALDVKIEIIWPWSGRKDWNDVVMAEGELGGASAACGLKVRPAASE